MNFTIPGCEGRGSEHFKMIVSTETASRQRSTTVQGTFDQRLANFRWNGTYWGSAQKGEWSGEQRTVDDFAEGVFSVSFTGIIDSAQSDELKTGPVKPDWVASHERNGNVPRRSASSRVGNRHHTIGALVILAVAVLSRSWAS
jgi:hypothetical protein